MNPRASWRPCHGGSRRRKRKRRSRDKSYGLTFNGQYILLLHTKIVQYKYRNIDFVAQGCKDTEEIRNRSVSSLNGRILYGVIFVCNNKIYCPLKASPYDLSLDLLFLFSSFSSGEQSSNRGRVPRSCLQSRSILTSASST